MRENKNKEDKRNKACSKSFGSWGQTQWHLDLVKPILRTHIPNNRQSCQHKSIAHSEKCVTEVWAACFMLTTYWNHKMTTVNRYLPFNLALYLFPKEGPSDSSLSQKQKKKKPQKTTHHFNWQHHNYPVQLCYLKSKAFPWMALKGLDSSHSEPLDNCVQ